MFLNIITHLLPNARAWRITVDKKLRQFFDGLSGLGDSIKLFFDEIFTDIDPLQTRELTAWENQFGLRDVGLTDDERRLRLDATWKAIGGQDPRYIQDTLRANGFDVYVHEWWVPGSEAAIDVHACATPRNPFLVLSDGSVTFLYLTECGEALAQCGESIMDAGERVDPVGYPLVNKVSKTQRNFTVLCGEVLAESGEALAQCGEYIGFVDTPIQYFIPLDSTKWSYFLYIGGNIYGDAAQVDPKRKDEFEALCLKICPAQQWLGIIVEYV